MATHSSILAWRIPETEEPSRLLSLGSHRVVHGWSNLAAAVSCATLFIGTATSLLPLCPKPWQPLMSSQSVILSFQKRYRNRITMCNCEIDFFFFCSAYSLEKQGTACPWCVSVLLLSSILWYNVLSLFNHSVLKDIWVLSSSGLLPALLYTHVQILVWNNFISLLQMPE